MRLFGTPPEAHWQYDEDKFDDEPTQFCYSFAQNYQALKYFRLDHQNVPTDDLLSRIKITLASGFPCMFGFALHSSIYSSFNVQRGHIPCPCSDESKLGLSKKDKLLGNHALVAVGYNDYKAMKYSDAPDLTTGAFLIRNSWGTDWGLKGYGWLPYEYVLRAKTQDWWSLTKSEWLKKVVFGPGDTPDVGEGDTGQDY